MFSRVFISYTIFRDFVKQNFPKYDRVLKCFEKTYIGALQKTYEQIESRPDFHMNHGVFLRELWQG